MSHWSGRSAGGAVSCAEHQQSPHEWQSKSRFFVFLYWVRGNKWTGPSECQAALHQQCLELRSQVISLRSQVDTIQTVQRDFVQLSQSLQVVEKITKKDRSKWFLGVPLELLLLPRQVKLELIRQAESFELVKEILEEQVGEASSSSADPSWASEVYQDQNTSSPNGTKKGQRTFSVRSSGGCQWSRSALLWNAFLHQSDFWWTVDLGNTFVL